MRTKQEFNDTIIVAGGSPTTYGELRTNAAMTMLVTHKSMRETTTKVVQDDPNKFLSAMNGMAAVVVRLVEEIEGLSEKLDERDGAE